MQTSEHTTKRVVAQAIRSRDFSATFCSKSVQKMSYGQTLSCRNFTHSCHTRINIDGRWLRTLELCVLGCANKCHTDKWCQCDICSQIQECDKILVLSHFCHIFVTFAKCPTSDHSFSNDLRQKCLWCAPTHCVNCSHDPCCHRMTFVCFPHFDFSPVSPFRRREGP